MWADERGVEVASIANPADCASVVPQLLIPGGSQPFYARGDEQAGDPNARQPGDAPPPKCPPSCPPPLRLHAAFSVAPKRPRAHRRVVFDARRSSGAIASYAWKFGDRGKGTGRRATHRYGKRKTYAVSLTVRDRASRRATVAHKVKVRR